MINDISPNTEAILLLTAPLIVGRGGLSAKLLSQGEYNRLARLLRDNQSEPADLLQPGAQGLIEMCLAVVEGERLRQLLGRGFLLSQAIERWRSRAMWVVSRADSEYPHRLKERLKDSAPAVIYGCGDDEVLNNGGLAIVGSRHVDETLIAYTENIGRLAAGASLTVVSGGARGIDQAAMRGALEAGGTVAGVLSDSLERAVLVREHRDFIMEGRLALISPYDPAAGFDVGHAMNRNKVVYGLADAALVVSSDYQTGGTWAGATEQLEKLHFVPVYVRANGSANKGLEALRQRGARNWPNPETPEALLDALAAGDTLIKQNEFRQTELPLIAREEPTAKYESGVPFEPAESVMAPPQALPAMAPAEELFATVKQLLLRIDRPKSVIEIAAELQVSKVQAKEWLERLVKEGVLDRKKKPVRYCISNFGQQGVLGVQDKERA